MTTTNHHIRNPERWSKRRAERQQRRVRSSRPASYRLSDVQTQLALLSESVGKINGAAISCHKRVTRYYGLHNKCWTVPGYRK